MTAAAAAGPDGRGSRPAGAPHPPRAAKVYATAAAPCPAGAHHAGRSPGCGPADGGLGRGPQFPGRRFIPALSAGW